MALEGKKPPLGMMRIHGRTRKRALWFISSYPLCDSRKPGTLVRGPVGSDPSFFAPNHQDVTQEILGTDSRILSLYSVLRVAGKPVGQKQTRFGDIGQWGHDAWRFRQKSFIVYLAVDGKPFRQEQSLIKQN
jgi:hypothetical protein